MTEELAPDESFYYVSRIGGAEGKLQSIRVNSLDAAVPMAAVDLRTSMSDPVEVRQGESLLYDRAALLELIDRRHRPR